MRLPTSTLLRLLAAVLLLALPVACGHGDEGQDDPVTMADLIGTFDLTDFYLEVSGAPQEPENSPGWSGVLTIAADGSFARTVTLPGIFTGNETGTVGLDTENAVLTWTNSSACSYDTVFIYLPVDLWTGTGTPDCDPLLGNEHLTWHKR